MAYFVIDEKLVVDDCTQIGVGSDVGKTIGSMLRNGNVSTSPFLKTVKLDEKEIKIYAPLSGGWHKEKDQESTKKNENQYIATMQEIKRLSAHWNDQKDDSFVSLIEKSSTFMSDFFTSNGNEKIQHIVVAESTSALPLIFAWSLSQKLNVGISLAHKSRQSLEIDFEKIDNEVEKRKTDICMTDKKIEVLRQKYISGTKSAIKCCGKLGKETDFQIKGAGGAGYRRFIKGGYVVPNDITQIGRAHV